MDRDSLIPVKMQQTHLSSNSAASPKWIDLDLDTDQFSWSSPFLSEIDNKLVALIHTADFASIYQVIRRSGQANETKLDLINHF